MSEPFQGQCHCKAVSYTATGTKVSTFLCHCSDCRVLHGGGHLAGLALTEEDIVIKGMPQEYIYQGGSGSDIHVFFCSQCGTSLFARPTVHQGLLVLKANSLTDERQFQAEVSIFKESAFSWDTCLKTS